MSQSAEFQVQALLAEARSLLIKAGRLAADEGLGEQQFMGMVFEPSFGWFTPDGVLQESSDWNFSSCVIGSKYARCYGMEGWKDMGNDSWKLDQE